MDTLLKRFAKRLAHLREESGLSQEALAAACKLHPTYISSLERGLKVPRLTTLEQLAKGLKVEMSALMNFPDQANKKDDTAREEIILIVKSLEKTDAEMLRKIRKVIQALTA